MVDVIYTVDEWPDELRIGPDSHPFESMGRSGEYPKLADGSVLRFGNLINIHVANGYASYKVVRYEGMDEVAVLLDSAIHGVKRDV